MKGWSSLLLVAVFVGYGVENGCSIMGSPVSRRFPLGSIGCLFGSQLCQRGQECIDDRLFGTCQGRRVARDMYQYLLDRDTLDVLETEIWELIKTGFSWRDPHTQCLLQNILVSYRENVKFDRSLCNGVSQFQENTESDISKVLKSLFNYYDRNEDKASFDSEPFDDSSNDEYAADYNSQKRDEFLKIHKYFAPSRSEWKRRVDEVPYTNENLQNNEIENEVDNVIRAMDDGDSLGNYNDLTEDDVNKLQLYLDALQEVAQMYGNGDDMDTPEQSSEEIGETEMAPTEGGGAFWSSSEIRYPTSPAIDSEEQPLPGIDLSILETDDNSADNKPAIFPDSEDDNRKSLGDTMTAEEGLEETDNEISENGLSPRYAKLLADLLQDDLEPSKLSDQDLNQLTRIVNRLLQDLANQEDSISADVVDLKDGDISNEDLLGRVRSQDQSVIDPAYTELTAEGMASGEAPLETPQIDNSLMKKASISGNPDTPPEVSAESDDKEAKPSSEPSSEPEAFGVVDATYAYMTVDKEISLEEGEKLVDALARVLQIPPSSFSVTNVHDKRVTFQISPDLLQAANASSIVAAAGGHKEELAKWTGLTIISAGIGNEYGQVKIEVLGDDAASPKFFVLTFVLCGCIAGVLIGVVVLYLVKRHSRSKDKLAQLATEATGAEASQDYQDLCRQRMQSKTSEKPEPLHAAGRIGSVSESQVRSPSSRSSTSSWSEEPVTSSMDISTGHIVLSYMEDHLKNKDRLDREWEALTAYEADPCSTIVASDPANTRKNRYSDNLPYDHSRVVLADSSNVSGSDYINASTITDHDPRNPAYITTQGPLPHTVADFWQMVWEQGSVVVVMLTKLTENGAAMSHRYWPEEGSDLYHIYEVHLVSEHIWCDDYLVRSFYLKNLQTNETRTVTQFHFLTWHDNKVPGSVKALLDFRRKVNKSYRGRSCPIVVHCSDGSGRSGTYSLIDMVLNRLAKGAKEIDIAATLEHMRDQRMGMVKTKEQFEFVLAAVAEEVHAILKSLPQ